MAEDELTRLAAKLLEKEAQRFVRERSLKKPGPLKANKQFLTATLKHNEISNRRINEKLENSQHTQRQDTVKKLRKEISVVAKRSDKLFDSVTNPIMRHKFNSNLFKQKNRSPVSSLTKDSKVSFKFRNKKEESSVKTEESQQESTQETSKNEIISISDTDSVVSISSSDSLKVLGKISKIKNNKKRKRKKFKKERK